ncbi:hypothetical protein [Methylobacterium sp. WCS2018Hpa-22]|uniref:hypothetical protein n=1 Tax=Methylobacterium sp. WCS2018Hpa-22 TaxID=3073633 RepID=UPI00288A4A15|nr:hypothetical protein [Methylobacterium sp. WCS2018Hpa-22]
MQTHDEVEALRAALYHSRAEAISLRLDLSEAHGFVDALEAELWAITAWQSTALPMHADCERAAMGLLLRARTLIRCVLLQSHDPPLDRNASVNDLKIAEVAFEFLSKLRCLKAGA